MQRRIFVGELIDRRGLESANLYYASECSNMDLSNKEYKKLSLARFNVHDIYTIYKRVRHAWDPRYRAARFKIFFLLDLNWQLPR